MVAIDTVLGFKANPGASFSAVSYTAPDSGSVRAFGASDMAKLERVWRSGATAGGVQIKSPRLHDNVRGLQWISSTTPTVMLMPRNIGQPVYTTDTLAVALTGGTAETDLAVLAIYYTNLAGANGNYVMPADVMSRYVNYKIVEVDITTSATAGLWTDAALNSTEDLLIANTWYALLGYISDVNVGAVAIYGTDTGKLRVGGPGTSLTYDTSEYFIQWSEREGTPHIPVFQSNNKASIFASAADSAASTAVKTQFIFAQLSGQPF